MPAAHYRYTANALLGDYARAAAGFVVCVAPLAFTTVNWMTVLLAGLAVLFAAFGVKTAIRHATEYAVDGEGLRAIGPFGRALRWGDIDRFKIAYYATRRDRNGGWMEATIGGPQGRVKVDSGLEGFHDIVTQAAHAAAARRLELTAATHANLKALDVHVAGLEPAPLDGVGEK
jgi:hypothetical protein